MFLAFALLRKFCISKQQKLYCHWFKTEAWMSGLNQRFTKPSNLNWFREFESHRLRSQYLVSADPST